MRNRSAVLSTSALLATLTAVGLAGLASAHAAGSAHPDEWDRLMWIVLIMAILVAILVYSVMALALWRFRERSPFVRKEPSTHNARLETVWTLFPVVLVTIIVVLSLQVMQTTEDVPEEGIRVQVIGKQFEWVFVYPDNTTTTNDLWVEVGQTVIFEIWSTDVIHSFWLPDFRLKVDAFPNYVDESFIIAEPAGDYPIVCAEFCGDIHSEMLGTLHIYKKGLNDKPWGPPPGEVPPPPEVEHATFDVELREDGGSGSAAPWSMRPSLIEVNEGTEVTLRVWNNGTEVHSLYLSAPYARTVRDIPVGGSGYLNFTADYPSRGLLAYCPEDDHRVMGMKMTVVVNADTVEGGSGKESPVISPGVLYGSAVALLAVVMVVAVRNPGRATQEEVEAPVKEEKAAPAKEEKAELPDPGGGEGADPGEDGPDEKGGEGT